MTTPQTTPSSTARGPFYVLDEDGRPLRMSGRPLPFTWRSDAEGTARALAQEYGTPHRVTDHLDEGTLDRTKERTP